MFSRCMNGLCKKCNKVGDASLAESLVVVGDDAHTTDAECIMTQPGPAGQDGDAHTAVVVTQPGHAGQDSDAHTAGVEGGVALPGTSGQGSDANTGVEGKVTLLGSAEQGSDAHTAVVVTQPGPAGQGSDAHTAVVATLPGSVDQGSDAHTAVVVTQPGPAGQDLDAHPAGAEGGVALPGSAVQGSDSKKIGVEGKVTLPGSKGQDRDAHPAGAEGGVALPGPSGQVGDAIADLKGGVMRLGLGQPGDADGGAEGARLNQTNPPAAQRRRRRDYVSRTKMEYYEMTREERRKFYGYDSRPYIGLRDIPPWGDRGETLPNMETFRYPPSFTLSVDPQVQHDHVLNQRVSLIHSIEKEEKTVVLKTSNLEMEAIVHIISTMLLEGNLVRRFDLFQNGDPMARECKWQEECEEGAALVIGGYSLPADFVILTVPDNDNTPEVLAACYRSCLEEVRRRNLRTVVFPCICYQQRVPPMYATNAQLEMSIHLGVQILREWMDTGRRSYIRGLDRVIFLAHSRTEMFFFKHFLEIYFPLNLEDPLC